MDNPARPRLLARPVPDPTAAAARIAALEAEVERLTVRAENAEAAVGRARELADAMTDEADLHARYGGDQEAAACRQAALLLRDALADTARHPLAG